LRDRREDIPALIDHFVRKHASRIGKRIDGVGEGVVESLVAHDWPGNVRELENSIERAVVLSPGPVMTRHLFPSFGAPASATASTEASAGLPGLKLHTNIDWVERETVKRALVQSGGIKKDAAEAMGISQRALSYYLAKHHID
jgi:DNA-binding NtrC family response regulator